MIHLSIVKCNATGGICTPLQLNTLANVAAKFGAKVLNFGPRQEIFFNINKQKLSAFHTYLKTELPNVELETDEDTHPNIVSSYPAEGIFSGDYWLTEGIYKDIFDVFDFKPRLQINICDYDQNLVPFFTGQLNFVASGTVHYWFLYVKLSVDSPIVKWNRLIYSTDIPKIAREIEELYFNSQISDIEQINKIINDNVNYLYTEIHQELTLPRYVFPYYEGMYKYGNMFWLGIACRDYLFGLDFIKELSSLCINLNIGQLCITPWRSLLIKGIEQKDRILFEKLLGKYGINLRHTTSELNWLVSDINSDEMEIKKYLSEQFYKSESRTFGLVFGVKLASSGLIPASVVIEQKPFFHKDNLKLMSVYDVLYAQDFNPNSLERVVFARNVLKSNLYTTITKLCKLYYDSLTDFSETVVNEPPKSSTTNISTNKWVHQCKHCLTVYDAAFGNVLMDIPANTSFENLPDNFECPTCGAGKSAFYLLDFNLLNAVN